VSGGLGSEKARSVNLWEAANASYRPMIKAAGTEQAPTMVVVVNWIEELKARLPAK